MAWKYISCLLFLSLCLGKAEELPKEPKKLPEEPAKELPKEQVEGLLEDQPQPLPKELHKFSIHCAEQQGEEGTRASNHLLAGMPQADQTNLNGDFLIINFDYAYRARAEFPWCKELPEQLFFNDVLPYAALDETRETWRPKFYQLCKEIVKDCKTSGEAAQALNRELFKLINVHYNRGRKKPNQSPSESMETGKATCTGLSIILTYACRAVGIPARVVGTPLWSDKSGNHTWVEVWDNEWKYLGADEYDAKGLNRGWFGGRASKAKADNPIHAIWASSWTPGEAHFPMVWAWNNYQIPATNVTARYIKNAPNKKQVPTAGIRVFSKRGGPRVIATISLLDENDEVLQSLKSLADRADMNHVARVPLKGKGPWKILVQDADYEQRLTIQTPPEAIIDVVLSEGKKIFTYFDVIDAWKKEGLEKRQDELAKKVIQANGISMKFLERKYGAEPKGGHSLWISMHGGGGTATAVNDRQWLNQIQLYQPAEGYYIAPRAPTDEWDLWHREGMDALIDRLISNYVICRGVNPDRIYIMGYSAGGDGVFQLAPRMADRFASAAMMAGHPNDAQPANLRNLHFEIFMGGKDTHYNRHKKAANWKTRLADLQKADPTAYPHRVTIYPELGHWMERRDAEVLPRMIKQKRNSWPKKLVWHQDNITHERFYWLGVTPEGALKNRQITGEIKGQYIELTGDNLTGIKLWLSDELIDLDQEIIVTKNGKEAFRGKLNRSKDIVKQSLQMRAGMVATALLELE